jgi:hypothetical protein
MKSLLAGLLLLGASFGPVCAQQPTPDPIPNKPKPETPPAPAPPKPEDKPTTPPAAKEPPKKKPFDEITRNCMVFNGVFHIYEDRQTGAMYLFVKRNQIRQEFIYFSHVVDGVIGSGRTRGQFDHEDIFLMVKRFEKIDFVVQNTAYYFNPESPLSRASHANTSNAVVATEPILAENEEGFLLNAGNLFLKEAFMQAKRGGGGPGPEENKSMLGRLSDTKTKFIRWGSYPRDSFFVVEYVYENGSASRPDDDTRGLEDVVDPRYVSIRVQHTLVPVPQNDYQPRPDDPRVGYFMTQLTDQTSTDVTPFRDFIHRWYLKKKDPQAVFSEPVEPITWWIENTTPREFRETIKKAALLWNKSFERLGYKNALVIYEQPDDAKWSADDLDYNVLRWTSSPKAPFGGYGPHFVNPRTGQILGADVMLEFSFVKNRVMARQLWNELGMAGEAQSKNSIAIDPYACQAATMTQQGLLFGNSMLQLRHAEQVDFDTMLKESITQLILHELGHTLGLTHNFRASFLHTPEELQNRALTEKTGLSGSVMDYMPLNLGPDKNHQGQYYITAPGPYDDWAIEYGYSDALSDPDSEAQRLAAIAGRSHEKALAYANDADDMRKPGKSIDPRAQIFDMSSDPIAYGKARCELVQPALEKLLATYPKEGRSWQEVTQAYISLTTEESNALTAISRYIGGVYVERAFIGQVKQNAPDPFKPVPVEQQKIAMHVLEHCAFGPDAWKTSEDLLRHLQQQRRGFEFRDTGEDPKVHDRVLKLQRALLDHLLHANTQNRILDSALYGNTYTLPLMMHDLTQAIMAGEAPNTPISTIRQNLQLEYVNRLLGVLKNGAYFPAAQSVALYELQEIEKRIDGLQTNGIAENRPHIAHLLFTIQKGLDEKKT